MDVQCGSAWFVRLRHQDIDECGGFKHLGSL
jgi:hypothetical protein